MTAATSDIINRLTRIEDTLQNVEATLTRLTYLILKGEFQMSRLDSEINDLKNAVSADTDAVSSAVTLMNGIASKIDAAISAALSAGATQAELQSLSDLSAQIRNNKDALAAAVAANT